MPYPDGGGTATQHGIISGSNAPDSLHDKARRILNQAQRLSESAMHLRSRVVPPVPVNPSATKNPIGPPAEHLVFTLEAVQSELERAQAFLDEMNQRL